MPMFGFVCEDCGHSFEEWVRSSTTLEEVTCPGCASPRVQRQLSRIAGIGRSSGANPGLAPAPACSPGGV